MQDVVALESSAGIGSSVGHGAIMLVLTIIHTRVQNISITPGYKFTVDAMRERIQARVKAEMQTELVSCGLVLTPNPGTERREGQLSCRRAERRSTGKRPYGLQDM